MKRKKSLPALVLTLALGLGVWGAAVSFGTFSFSDGDVLSASDLNALLNTNFGNAETAINDLEADVADLRADLNDAEAAIDARFESTGGTITGLTKIEAEAASGIVLNVKNKASGGQAAIFEASTSGNDNGAVNIKQTGSGPALALKSTGAPFIGGAYGTVNFLVEADGSIKIGNMGVDGTEDPAIHLNAAAGTVTNSHGSGLPVAFGTVNGSGAILSGTNNFMVERNAVGTYYITFNDFNYNYKEYTTITSPLTTALNAVANNDSIGGTKLVVKTGTGSTASDIGFQFVTYKNPL